MTVPVSVRWNKWRMWRQKDGSWLAQQPFQIKDPMFKHRSNSGDEWPVFSYRSDDPARVLHEMQLAMAKAAADPEALRVEFTATNGKTLKPGVKVRVMEGSFITREGVVRSVREKAHKRSRYSKEKGDLPIVVEFGGGLTGVNAWSYGPDDLEVIE